MSLPGPDGEIGQPTLWRQLREPQEPLPKVVTVFGDGEKNR